MLMTVTHPRTIKSESMGAGPDTDTKKQNKTETSQMNKTQEHV